MNALTPQERLAWSLIQTRERERAISLPDLSRASGIEPRTLRRVIRRLVVTHHKPIGSTSAGYFDLQTPQDVEKNANRFIQIGVQYIKRGRELKNDITIEEIVGQFRLEG